MKPFCQNLQKTGDQTIWQVNAITSSACENIILPLLSDDFCSFELKHNGLKCEISGKQLVFGSEAGSSEESLSYLVHLADQFAATANRQAGTKRRLNLRTRSTV